MTFVQTLSNHHSYKGLKIKLYDSLKSLKKLCHQTYYKVQNCDLSASLKNLSLFAQERAKISANHF